MPNKTSLIPATRVLYEATVRSLSLGVGSEVIDFTESLKNGRASYEIFEELIARLLGLHRYGAQGLDHVDITGTGYQQKGFCDVGVYPKESEDWFHTAASCTASGNNLGPEIKELLQNGRYAQALKICRETGYDKADYYIYTNTGQFSTQVPLRFVILPTSDVLSLLSKKDPRLINRRQVLDKVTEIVSLD